VSFLSQPLQTILIRPKRMVETIAVQVVVNEQATDTLTITKQPVQQGAAITDHAYLEPTSFSHTIYFAAAGFEGLVGPSSLAKVYQQLLTLQAKATPFDIVTPKRVYSNMLMTTLTQTTDKLTENCLAIHAAYQQIIIVPISTGIVPRNQQKNAGRTGATQAAGQKSSVLNSQVQGASTFLKSLVGGV
jgi:hypothetical protein